MTNQELEALKKALLIRDHRGLNELYLNSRDSCIKILTSKNYCDKEKALEVFTDAVLILRKNIISGKITSLTNPINYIISVCNNIIRSDNRREKKIVNKKEEVRLLFYESGYNSAEENIQKEHQISICKEALSRLSERCQKILIAFYIHELSMQEIAFEFEFSSSDVAKTIKSRCFKSWKKTVKELM